MRTAAGTFTPLDEVAWRGQMTQACDGLRDVSVDRLSADARRNVYDGIPEAELQLATIMAARGLIDLEPDCTYVAARLLLDAWRAEHARVVT